MGEAKRLHERGPGPDGAPSGGHRSARPARSPRLRDTRSPALLQRPQEVENEEEKGRGGERGLVGALGAKLARSLLPLTAWSCSAAPSNRAEV